MKKYLLKSLILLVFISTIISCNNSAKNDKLNIEYDKKKFEEVYNEEMKKMDADTTIEKADKKINTGVGFNVITDKYKNRTETYSQFNKNTWFKNGKKEYEAMINDIIQKMDEGKLDSLTIYTKSYSNQENLENHK